MGHVNHGLDFRLIATYPTPKDKDLDAMKDYEGRGIWWHGRPHFTIS
jgi:hypothetical protein